MAPGVNGGRQTGTVPKTKSHNGTSRDYANRREQSLNHIPNNLVPLEWQSVSDPRQPRTRKTSNTQCSSFDYYDAGTSASLAPEDTVLHDNRVLLSHFAQTDDQLLWATMNRNSQEMNGCSESTASTSNSSRRSRTPRNVLPEKENKSNNITKMPDRNQVVSRLNEIRDYIKQTSSLMDTLKNSGDPRHLAHYQKLSKMVADLRDSEARLEALLSPLPGIESKIQDVKLSTESASENGTALPGQPMANTYNSHGNTRGTRRQRGVSEGSSTTRSLSEEPTGAVLKSSDSSRRNELKMKVEESQRKLQALQDHQAALVSLQQKAQNQLKEAKVAQGMLLARAGLQPSTSPSLLDQHAGSSNVQSNGVDSSPCILGNMQSLEDRLHTLHELYENRNQLVQILGERDEELTSDHMVLQDKLQELQNKKQQMDHLVAEFQALNNPSVSPGLQGDASSSKNGSDEGEASDDDDYKIVQQKIAELHMMKAQLAQLKGMVSTVENGVVARNGIDEVAGALEEAELEQEEQAVNLRRQKKEKGKSGEMKPIVRSNSNTSAGDSNKPDNISQASSEIERIRDIQNKTIQLQEAKARLQHLTDLLATVSGFHNQGQPIPSQYLEILNQEASDGDAGRSSSQPPTGSRSLRQSMERDQCRQSQENSVEGLPEGEITMEQVQAITQDLRHQTRCLNEEREKLIQARLKLGTLARDIPLREKKTNTQVDAQTQQLLLQAELQAKRRELEELMRKDQGQTSSINQDICSEVSVKSETQGYSYLAEGTTTNATWGGSTQGTLDDLGEQDNDVQEQSAGYSSDDGQDDEDEEERTYTTSPSQQLRLAQLNNNKDTLSQSVATSRDLLSMSLDSGRVSLSGNINSNRSNATSIADSTGPAMQVGSSHSSRRGPGSHNVWRKASADSGSAPPRAVWMRPSQGRQENSSAAEDLVTSSATSEVPPSHPASACNWWQQHAVQLQHQLELTNNLCQNMLIEQAQQHHMSNNNLLAGAPPASLAPFWGFPLPTYPLAQHPHPISAPGGSLVPANMAAVPDVYYQQLLAASQMQQQQMMVTTMNQCCHLLWLQQKEMAALRTAIGALQEKTSQGSNEGGESYSPPVMIGQPEETVFISSTQNSAHPTPRQSLSNLSRLQQSGANLSTPVNPHQNLKISYSGGLFQSPEDMTGSSGVTSAHSLPNLSQATVATGSVFSSHQPEVSSSSASNPSHNAGTLLNNMATHGFHPGILPMPFPTNNNINFNNRSQQQPLSSFIQPGSGAPWLQQGPHGGHTNPSPVPALNNQVPPGNRANNYWDNFRSYSRQNLLSTSTKSNEGVSHSPSPLVDRSHNTLRGSASLSAPVTQSVSSALHGVAPLFSGPEHNPGSCSMSSRKEKLNTEQYHNSQDNFSIPGSSHNIMTPDGTALRYHIGDATASSGSRPGSRQHNCSEFHLQTNASRGHSQHHNISPIRSSMRDSGLVHHHGDRQAHSEHHNLSAMADYCLESNITVEISPLGSTSHHNFTSPDSIITYEQFSDHLHTPKMQDDAAGPCKRKTTKSVGVGEAKGQTQVAAASGSSGRKQQATNSLFEALSESVYAEVATLISANQNRPHFLIQLFRDLQMINSDPLRQRTLQSIHEVVSRYLANCHQTESNLNPAYGENQQPNQNENSAVTSDLIPNGSAASSDEELGKDEGNNYHVSESFGASLVGQCTESHMQNLATVEEAQTIAENEEGAAALPSSNSSPHVLPRNAAWSIKDGLTLSTELPGRGSKLEWEVQGVVVDLLPFLRDHLSETCTPALLETVRTLTLQLVPTENLSIVPPSKTISSSSSVHHSQLGCCYQGQLDALLEDALLKFQGCRLRDVSEELLNAIADVLLSELTFLRLVDTVSRGDNNENNEENPSLRDCSVEEHTHAGTIEASRFMNPESNETNYHGSQDVNLGTEAYNGDLAEADQSRHEESGADVEAESAGALGLDIPAGSHVEAQGSPAEGTACALNESNGTTKITEVEEEWEVEQDREQGLDRVPTRLSTDQQRATACSGNSTPERDIHGPIPHSDAPIP